MRLSAHMCVPRSIGVLAVAAGIAVAAPAAHAATLTVCASGCTFVDFQLALNAAQFGDTILLRAGETFIGNFVLPAKSGSGTILVRSDAPDSSLPDASTRLVPYGYAGGNTDLRSLARLRGQGGIWKTTPVIDAAQGAHGYRLQFLDIDGVAQEGWETIVELGNNSPQQSTFESVPYAITLDRVFVHGHPTKAQKRGVSLNGRDLALLNSFVIGCGSWEVDAQAVAGFNGPGPFRIINNYLEATGENVMFGGADPRIYGLIPSNIEIRRNHFFKPAAWRDPILAPPSGTPSASVTAGAGSLSAGTHYFTVVAVLEAASEIAVSAQSAERAVSVGSSGSAVTLTWNAVAGADRYRIYRGTWSRGQDRYLETSGATTSLTYRGTGEIGGVPRAQGNRWNIKNLLELKNARNVLIEGNVFEQLWPASQQGYAILLTPRNADGASPWSVVSDITLVNNVIRHVAGGVSILGIDDERGSERTGRVAIRNNLVYDLSRTWGGASHFLLMSRAPYDVSVDHNTIFHEGMVVIIDDGASPGFQFTNNLAPHNDYGIFGSGAGIGSSAIAAYFPESVVRRNALGGGPAALYPADNFFPDMSSFSAQFVNIGAEDFRLVSGSTFRNAGTDGRNLGADFTALDAATQGVVTSDGAGPGGDGGGDGSGGGGGSAPFGGTSAALPGVVQAENFDDGANGVAYSDTTPGNSGGQYRSTDVDIEATADTGGGYNLGWVKPGERLNYTVNVAAAGTYTIEFRVAASGAGGTFHLEVNGTDKTGTVTIPNTGSWQSWTTITRTGISLAAGQQTWTVVMDGPGAGTSVGNFNYMRVSGSSPSGGSAPFGGTAATLPGTLEAENFDQGGEGVAYHDSTPGNDGGQYRSTNVDVGSCSDTGGGYRLGWIAAGEWLAYTVNVSTAGTYDIEARVASNGGGGTFHIEVNGVDRTGPLTVPNTGGWQAWTTIRRTGVQLSAGSQVWRVVMDTVGSTGAVGNINWIRAASGGTGSTPFGGVTASLPGVLEMENYDSGGEGVAYHDLSPGNEGGQYRTTNVDIAAAYDTGGGFTLGWVGAGEWLNYTVNVGTAGTYTLDVRVASSGAGGTFHIEVNGVDKTGPMSVPNTGGWQTWATVRKTGVSLPAGPQVWRVVMDGNGATGAVGNFNHIRVVAQ